MDNDFQYKIEKHIGVISEQQGQNGALYRKELNLISYNGRFPKFDIRTWAHKTNVRPQMGKGITLDYNEFRALTELVAKTNKEINKKDAPSGQQGEVSSKRSEDNDYGLVF